MPQSETSVSVREWAEMWQTRAWGTLPSAQNYSKVLEAARAAYSLLEAWEEHQLLDFDGWMEAIDASFCSSTQE